MALRSAPSRITGVPARVVSAPKMVDEFYSSPAWRALVADRKLDPDYVQAKARTKRGERLILDHVDERRDGGADLDPANTQWLTFSEHQVKTAAARARRARGRV